MPVFGWLFVIIVLGGIIIGSLIHKYRYRNMNLIYTAFGQENYFNIISKLKADGVTIQGKHLVIEKDPLLTTRNTIFMSKRQMSI